MWKRIAVSVAVLIAALSFPVARASAATSVFEVGAVVDFGDVAVGETVTRCVLVREHFGQFPNPDVCDVVFGGDLCHPNVGSPDEPEPSQAQPYTGEYHLDDPSNAFAITSSFTGIGGYGQLRLDIAFTRPAVGSDAQVVVRMFCGPNPPAWEYGRIALTWDGSLGPPGPPPVVSEAPFAALLSLSTVVIGAGGYFALRRRRSAL
jgi:hypothetical protein